jgi:hypothetical protein
MKIRIKSNSVRYRLTRTDVARLAKEGHLEDIVAFAEQSLIYSVKLNNEEQLSSAFKNNTITLYVPKAMLTELMNTDRVGFENNDGPLHLLLEKDFTCPDNVTEDQSDNYPNPLADKTK